MLSYEKKIHSKRHLNIQLHNDCGPIQEGQLK